MDQERYQTYTGAALKQIDTKLHNLPNMVIAECWFPCFDNEEGTIKFQWPHYTEVDGQMVQVSPFLEPQTSREGATSLHGRWLNKAQWSS
jgi:hypothetical protein